MRELLQKKFQDPVLRRQLIDTMTEELIEGNKWHDNFWGVCGCKECQGRGSNHLGRLLMEIRQYWIRELAFG